MSVSEHFEALCENLKPEDINENTVTELEKHEGKVLFTIEMEGKKYQGLIGLYGVVYIYENGFCYGMDGITTSLSISSSCQDKLIELFNPVSITLDKNNNKVYQYIEAGACDYD